MSDLQALRESILNKAHQEGQAQLDKARIEIDKDYQERLESLLKEKEKTRNVVLNRESHRLTRLEQQRMNQERQGSLNARQVLIDQLFDGAIIKMTNWDETAIVEFVKKVLGQFEGQALTLVFGEKTKQHLSSQALEQLQQAFGQITFSDEVVSNKAGFILKDQHIDYNYLFDRLVNSLRQELSAELAQQVFNTNK